MEYRNYKVKLMNIWNIKSVMWMGVIMVFMMASCSKNKKETTNDEELEHICCEPPEVALYLVPLDGMTEAKVKKLGEEFMEHFGSRQPEEYFLHVLPRMSSPDSCLNKGNTRLRAEKLTSMLYTKFEREIRTLEDVYYPEYSDFYIMGVTNRDISTPRLGHEDYGVLGLSYIHGIHAGVISTHRLRNQKDLWKLAAHEFCHGFYGCPHCKKDNPNCLMADAKGGDPQFGIKDTLCNDCAKICSISY